MAENWQKMTNHGWKLANFRQTIAENSQKIDKLWLKIDRKWQNIVENWRVMAAIDEVPIIIIAIKYRVLRRKCITFCEINPKNPDVVQCFIHTNIEIKYSNQDIVVNSYMSGKKIHMIKQNM